MTRNIICILLAGLIVIGSMISIQNIQSIVIKSQKEIEMACHAYQAGRSEICLQHLVSGESIWMQHKTFLSAVLSHREIEEIIQGFSELKILSKRKEDVDYFTCSASLLATIDQILDKEYPKPGNILCHML